MIRVENALRVLLRVFLVAATCAAARTPAMAQLQAATKWRYDAGNTGWNPQEIALTPASVGSRNFRKIWQRDVDGQVYAQPLYVRNVPIAGKGTHNVVFVATEHNTLYAFDANSAVAPNNLPLWQVSFGQSVPTPSIGCYDLAPEYGITATPAIDPATNTLYLTSKTLENGRQVWRVHAVDIRSGQKIAGWGFPITATVPTTGGGTVTFNPDIQLNRSALMLMNGRLYIAFGSHCDIRINEYRGWLYAYNAKAPAEAPQVLCTSPGSNGDKEAANGLWMSGASPAFDSNGNMFFMTGNGPFNIDIGGADMGDSYVKLATNGGAGLFFNGQPTDYFTPNNQDWLRIVDADLGSGGLTVLPDQPGTATPHLLVGGGKDTLLRLINRDNMGGFSGRTDPNTPNRVQQEIGGHGSGFWSSPAYWRTTGTSYVYVNGVGDAVKQYRLSVDQNGNSKLVFEKSTQTFSGYPSSTPVVSSDGTRAGSSVVWILNRATNALHAFDGSDVSKELYNSNVNGLRDTFGGVIKFTVPLVANGQVFVGADRKVVAFGLAEPDREFVYRISLKGAEVVNRNVPVSYQATILDPRGIPARITGKLALLRRLPDGRTEQLDPLVFQNQSSVIWTRSYAEVGQNQFIVVSDPDIRTTLPFTVKENTPTGIDHFAVTVPRKVVTGRPFQVLLTAKDRRNQNVPYSGWVWLRFTTAYGAMTYGSSAYFNGGSSALTGGVLSPLGPAIVVATNWQQTGTAATEVVDKLVLTGFAIPGDWKGHSRLRATVRLLDRSNHATVIQSTSVILGDDDSFRVEVPAGTYDVAVKVTHWLQQIAAGVDTSQEPVLNLRGPASQGLLNGDTNNDNVVDDTDVANVKADLGGLPSGNHGETDLNGDGTVDQADLEIVNRNKGKIGDR